MKVCANIIKYLQQKQKNVCIIHCVVSRSFVEQGTIDDTKNEKS